MPRIPESDIERLKEEVSVQRLVESAGIVLKKAGKDWLGCCPFHEDREASLVVTPGKNLWHCFGCQIGGGPIDWVMKARGVSFRHAVELLKADPSLAAVAAGKGEGGREKGVVVILADFTAIGIVGEETNTLVGCASSAVRHLSCDRRRDSAGNAPASAW